MIYLLKNSSFFNKLPKFISIDLCGSYEHGTKNILSMFAYLFVLAFFIYLFVDLIIPNTFLIFVICCNFLTYNVI